MVSHLRRQVTYSSLPRYSICHILHLPGRKILCRVIIKTLRRIDSIYTMEKIPFDIIINHIIPYTYTTQSKILLEDIKNYYSIKSNIMGDPYSTSIKLELLVFFHFKSMLNTILNRHFSIRAKQYNYDNIKSCSLEQKFSILFGLLTKEERTQGLRYVTSRA